MHIFKYPQDEILRQPCNMIEHVTQELRALLDEMVPFMREHEGVGLAAPQIGSDGCFFVCEFDGHVYKVINPEIVRVDSVAEIRREGCLSVPEMIVPVKRSISIQVKFLDERGAACEMSLEGMGARIFQHEYDHLNGRLIVDHMDFTLGIGE